MEKDVDDSNEEVLPDESVSKEMTPEAVTSRFTREETEDENDDEDTEEKTEEATRPKRTAKKSGRYDDYITDEAECGKCTNCKDKKKFGGVGRKKKACNSRFQFQ